MRKSSIDWFNSLHLGLIGSFGALLLGEQGSSCSRRLGFRLIALLLLLLGALYLLPAEELLRLRGERMAVWDFFAAFLLRSGAGDFILKLAQAATRNLRALIAMTVSLLKIKKIQPPSA